MKVAGSRARRALRSRMSAKATSRRDSGCPTATAWNGTRGMHQATRKRCERAALSCCPLELPRRVPAMNSVPDQRSTSRLVPAVGNRVQTQPCYDDVLDGASIGNSIGGFSVHHQF